MYRAADQDYWKVLTAAEAAWLRQFNREYYLGMRSAKNKILEMDDIRSADRTRKRVKADLLIRVETSKVHLHTTIGESAELADILSEEAGMWYREAALYELAFLL